jgi:hypothetical protein
MTPRAQKYEVKEIDLGMDLEYYDTPYDTPHAPKITKQTTQNSRVRVP